MSDFAFVPRSISKRKAATTTATQPPIKKDVIPFREEPSSSKEPTVKPKFTTDDILTLLHLCLSRYSCWFNHKLLEMIQKSGDGYVPIQYLLEHVSPLCELENKPTELEITYALRSAGDTQHNLDVRMIIQEPSRNVWLSSDSGSAHTSGLFEIRRRDFEELIRSFNDDPQVTKGYWDSQTIYIERIPTMYRTKHAIAQYVYHLLVNAKHGLGESSKLGHPIQSISFPRHHSDSEGKALPRYKGFAFVVLDSPSSVKALTEAYPWNNPHTQSEVRGISEDGGPKYGLSGTETEAVKFGTRTLSKTSWDRLKDEYLDYQKTILALDNRTDLEGGLAGTTPTITLEKKEVPVLVQDQTGISRDILPLPPPTRVPFTLPRTYPANCLIFVKNIHPETNKTTLRQFFASALSSPAALDYVDFTKGIDSCHLRLINASEAAKLVSFFGLGHGKSGASQLHALDSRGGPPTIDRPALILELVQGRREELYWERVPQNLREKALITAQSQSASLQGNGEPDPDIANKAKRRRKQP